MGAPGSGKTLLLNLISALLLMAEARDSVQEPSREYQGILDSLIPQYRQALSRNGYIKIVLEHGNRNCTMEVQGELGYPRLIECNLDITPVILSEYRVYMLKMLTKRFDKEIDKDNKLWSHMREILEQIRISQKNYGDYEAGKLARVFNDMLSKMLEVKVHEPIDLTDMKTWLGVPLYRESYTLLNLVTLAAGLAKAVTRQPSVLVIDTPEHGLTLQQVPVLTELLAEITTEYEDVKLLVATHNNLIPALTAMRAIEKSLQDTIEIYEFRLNKKYNTEFQKLPLQRIPSYIVQGYEKILKLLKKRENNQYQQHVPLNRFM